jgi:hypothetical protein
MLEDGLEHNGMNIEVVGLTETLAEHLINAKPSSGTGE